MKNIYVLSTHKSSRLWINNLLQGKLELNEEALLFNTAQHLYITSDEKIKDGDYYLYLKDNSVQQFIKKHHIKLLALDIQKKIILTTDQDLIADGIQAIDDNFIEWFIKNPSCEEIKFEVVNDNIEWYKIIIPKEEPKPFKQMEKLTEVDWTKFKKSPIPSKKEEPKQELERGITITHVGKQETLEETAEKLVPEASCELNNSEASYWQQGWINGHTKGAKWQAERMYSEEDMRKAIQETITLMRYKATEFREHENTILKQFKKK